MYGIYGYDASLGGKKELMSSRDKNPGIRGMIVLINGSLPVPRSLTTSTYASQNSYNTYCIYTFVQQYVATTVSAANRSFG